MNTHSLIVGVLLATSAAAAEPTIFHTSHFTDRTTVEWTLLSSRFSAAIGYDFDVTIGLMEFRGDEQLAYRDPSPHPALVRCGTPSSVFVGGADYRIGGKTSSLASDNWKLDLWRAVCAVPTS